MRLSAEAVSLARIAPRYAYQDDDEAAAGGGGFGGRMDGRKIGVSGRLIVYTECNPNRWYAIAM